MSAVFDICRGSGFQPRLPTSGLDRGEDTAPTVGCRPFQGRSRQDAAPTTGRRSHGCRSHSKMPLPRVPLPRQDAAPTAGRRFHSGMPALPRVGIAARTPLPQRDAGPTRVDRGKMPLPQRDAGPTRVDRGEDRRSHRCRSHSKMPVPQRDAGPVGSRLEAAPTAAHCSVQLLGQKTMACAQSFGHRTNK